ncbi:hypothetical protein FISHEDRAFT_73031 [Fistulina hepatica ATCC 64428]|uniref:Uncharacterized protein n=1 Tax=Fistulina hepatica ATCC 64428 TaxID=1128425 RepID=A0A0D7ADG5_9AGAR|nr:hypothetical protein FISHEDRAFT_73031 [Fistulina hepatica ATCC 64428]
MIGRSRPIATVPALSPALALETVAPLGRARARGLDGPSDEGVTITPAGLRHGHARVSAREIGESGTFVPPISPPPHLAMADAAPPRPRPLPLGLCGPGRNAVIASSSTSTAAFCGRHLCLAPNDHTVVVGLRLDTDGHSRSSTAALCSGGGLSTLEDRVLRSPRSSTAPPLPCAAVAVFLPSRTAERGPRGRPLPHHCARQRWRPFCPRGPRSAVLEVLHRSTAALCSGGGLFALEDRRTRSSRCSTATPLHSAVAAAFPPRRPRFAAVRLFLSPTTMSCGRWARSERGRPQNAVVTSCSTTTAAFCGRLLLPEPNDHLVWSLGFGSASTTAPRGRHVVPHFDGRSTRPSLLEPNGHLVWPLGSPSSLTAALRGRQLLEPNDHIVWPLGSRSTSTTALCGRRIVRPPRRPLNAAVGSFLSPTTTRCGHWAHPRPRRPRNVVVRSSLTSTAALRGRRFFLAPNGHLVWPLGSPSTPTATFRGRRLLREPNGHLAWLLGSPLMTTTASCGRRVIVELDGRLAQLLEFPSSPSTAQRACRVVLDLGHHFAWWPGSYL